MEFSIKGPYQFFLYPPPPHELKLIENSIIFWGKHSLMFYVEGYKSPVWVESVRMREIFLQSGGDLGVGHYDGACWNMIPTQH